MKEGWEYKKLGEIATEMYRGSGIKRDQVTKEGTPCVRYGEIYTTYNISFDTCVSHTNIESITSPKYFEHGDLLFAITGESVEDIGKTIAYLGDEKCLCGGDIICMKHRQNPKYLAYALSTPDAIRQKGIGKTKLKVVHTNAPALKAISIPLAPLPEQQSIVDYLDSAFAKIDAMKANAEKALNEAKALFQASLKEMLEPKEGWEEKILQDICSDIVDCPHTTPQKVGFPTQYPCIRTSELKGGRIDWSTMQYLDEDEYKKRVSRLVPKANDLVYGREGTYGDAVLLPDGYSFSLGQRTMLLRPNEIYIIPRFLLYSMISPHVYQQAKAKNSGCGVGHVNVKDIKVFRIGLPTIDIQQSIVDTLDSLKSKVDRLQANYDKISQECDALKQAILRQVFE